MVLAYIDNSNGKFKKAALEVVTYGAKVAKASGSECIALVFGSTDQTASLGKYGASKVIHVTNDNLNTFCSQSHAKAICDVASSIGAKTIVLSQNASGKAMQGRIAARLDAGSVTGVFTVPTFDDGVIVKKKVFSGKAIATIKLDSDIQVLSLASNSFAPEETGSDAAVEQMTLDVAPPQVIVKELKKVEGGIPLPEAEIVVSAGRGMKGPENWEIIEELANQLGAATACSRPVADSDWRPHHEHVGQTGVAINPNLYIAIGISGAIQHLAGVNNSKVIVVINKDDEAPFFKAADYGVCGDLFEVVPKLIEAIKKFKAS